MNRTKFTLSVKVRVDCQHQQDSKSTDKSTNTAFYVNFSNNETLAPKLSITISKGFGYHSRKVVKYFKFCFFFFFPAGMKEI